MCQIGQNKRERGNDSKQHNIKIQEKLSFPNTNLSDALKIYYKRKGKEQGITG